LRRHRDASIGRPRLPRGHGKQRHQNAPEGAECSFHGTLLGLGSLGRYRIKDDASVSKRPSWSLQREIGDIRTMALVSLRTQVTLPGDSLGTSSTSYTGGRLMSVRTSSPTARLLVVEDDPDIAMLLAHSLSRAGFTVETLSSGGEVLAEARRRTPDLILLDLMLPGLDGLEVCRALRADPATAALPVIMLTARAEESDRIVGLELGADDYITKPFSPNEVVARVRALLRRAQRPDARAQLRYGPLVMDVERHTVVADGRAVHLTAKEFLLLQYLLEHQGRVLSRDLLLSDVWGYAYTGGTRTVDVHVRRLREKLPLLADSLQTVKQFGYKLAEPG
jgi:DNA-binding response OmpR family regulator